MTFSDQDVAHYRLALEDFRRARRRAALEQMMARLTDRSAELLSYQEVQDKLKLSERSAPELKEIPLDAIVGSVGRYTDFTRRFLPKKESSLARWVGVQQAAIGMTGLPPIEVYQVGEVYFVLDGNHRVSVARQLDSETIQAYVTRFQTPVPLAPDVQPDDLIVKAEYADWLERTRLDRTRPGADLAVTNPGRYRELDEHIAVHRYFMGLEQQREIPYPEAATHWYDTVYLPVAQVIRSRGILREFPGRTETDLYGWLLRHRAELEDELGLPVDIGVAAADLRPKPAGVIARVLESFVPAGLEPEPDPGIWRLEHLAARQAGGDGDRLFADLLVPVSGEAVGWQALEQALVVARREGSRLHGLCVLPSEEERAAGPAQAVRAEFERRCQAAGVVGRLALVVGQVARRICERARWVDLVVANLSYPPPPQPLARLGSGFRSLLRTCPRPVLAVPGVTTPLEQALLAYDGSAKAEEALFVAAYLASRWSVPLTVVVVESDPSAGQAAARAAAYLSARGVQATLVRDQGKVGDVILTTAQDRRSDLILMGGYGHSPVVEIVLGSAVDQVLRESGRPVLICR